MKRNSELGARRRVMPLAEYHRKSLAQFEGKRYCSIAAAMEYLDLSRTTMDELLNSQKVSSQYFGHKLRKVVVASLLEVDKYMPIDRPPPSGGPGWWR